MAAFAALPCDAFFRALIVFAVPERMEEGRGRFRSVIDSNAPGRAAATCRFALIAGRDRVRQFRHVIVAFAILFRVATAKQQVQPLSIRSHGRAMRALFVASVPLTFWATCFAMVGRFLSRRSQADKYL